MTYTENIPSIDPKPEHLQDSDESFVLESYTLDDIAAIAYELWEQRGGEGGSPVEDWMEAERLLRTRAARAA